MSSTLRAQLSLPKVQFRQGFQLILHGFAAMPGKHGNDSNLPPAGCLQPLHSDMMIVDGDIGFLLHRLSFFYCLLSLPTRRLWGLCRRGWAGTLPIAEERHTGRHRANGRGFTARPCGSDHGGRLYGGPVQECVPAGNESCPPSPGPLPLRGDSAKSGGYSSTLMRTQVRCVCLLINHLQNASGNVAESGFLLFQIPLTTPPEKTAW